MNGKTERPETSVENRVKCSLNRSKSKQSYSFGKAIRFKDNPKDIHFAFYNFKSTLSPRGTSMGYGKKFDFTKTLQMSQSQCLYGFPSTFDPKYHNSPQYTFGTSRPKIRSSSNGPGPIYDLSKIFGGDAPKYTIRDKSRNKHIVTRLNNPGPGTYFKPAPLGIMGKYFDSKYKNSVLINLDLKTKRFLPRKEDNYPGPQTYRLPSLMNIGGYIYESKYKSGLGRSFVGVKVVKEKKDNITPGPGAYKMFSEFEGFDVLKKPKKYKAKNNNKVN